LLRQNVSLLVLVALVGVYVQPPRPKYPAWGNGEERVRTQAPAPKERARPSWMPRRHLPLVKLPSLDSQIPRTVESVPHVHLRVTSYDGADTTPRQDHSGRPDAARSPPQT
jgi:hypothetical protein